MLAATKDANIHEAHVAMVGVRSIDDGEQKWLDEGNIKCMTMDDVNRQGLEQCLFNAVQTANGAAAGFGITIDLDAIDPLQAPFVATPVDGGLDGEELAKSLAAISRCESLLGMEVTEFTPRGDDDVAAGLNLVEKLVAGVCS